MLLCTCGCRVWSQVRAGLVDQRPRPEGAPALHRASPHPPSSRRLSDVEAAAAAGGAEFWSSTDEPASTKEPGVFTQNVDLVCACTCTFVAAWGSCVACWTAWTGWRRPVVPLWIPNSGSAASTMWQNAVQQSLASFTLRSGSRLAKAAFPPWSLSPGASRGFDGGAWSPQPSGLYGVCSWCW